MAKFQLLLPKMGESVAEATIVKWVKKPGDTVEADDTIAEIATDKVDSEIPSPVSGKLVEILFNEDDVVEVGKVIAIIEIEGEETAVETPQQPAPQQEASPAAEQPVQTPVQEQESYSIPGTDQLAQREVQAAPSISSSVRFYSPLVRNIAVAEGITNEELDSIPGTGADGRLTKDDLMAYLENRATSGNQQVQQPRAAQPQPVPQPVAKPVYTSPVGTASTSGNEEIIEMDRMRKLIADHMVMSKQVSPHVSSFVEADVTNLVMWRDKIKNSFEQREKEKITFTPIFVEAVVKAIKDFPLINVSVKNSQIIRKKDINISMATALPSGNLITPVIKNADQLNLAGLTRAVNDLANRARNNKLSPDDIKDGTFTITNIGTFGNIMGTPIINQPQVAILAIGAIKKKPAVIETPQGDMIAIRQMMYLSLSYDHRVVDGMLGGSFLKRIADYLENWDVKREE
ncbi:2-oxo acid dehydrogenase subunit E2 [Mucilaginibacter roseus]|uniref:Dihydrolipoamide acetyltransferase component of pyruvate dehydrogenase complex n=1 Tax=Mucilaginibacter roseus TaxID=1528868 RepID=A0ABS8U2G7_9SPHI|nr:dihydrolipoamide acetyltransferase family protein [Mucilaginibacter roseus]MCD8739974.1 2-oxo acid dehydrogenase subunit E2 [Mucilaginibacter roseus]